MNLIIEMMKSIAFKGNDKPLLSHAMRQTTFDSIFQKKSFIVIVTFTVSTVFNGSSEVSQVIQVSV